MTTARSIHSLTTLCLFVAGGVASIGASYSSADEPVTSDGDLYFREGLFGVQGSFEGTEVLLIVDSGSVVAAIDDDIVKQAFGENPLPDERRATRVQSSKQTEVRTFSGSVAIRSRPETRIKAMVVDMAGLSSVLELELDGIAGLNCFSDTALQLHGGNGLVLIGDVRPHQNGSSHAMKLRSRLLTTSAEIPIKGQMDFEIDTGMNEACQLPLATLELLERSGNAVRIPTTSVAFNADGTNVEVDRFHIRSVEYGGLMFRNVSASAGTRTSIGLGLLRYFTVTFDAPHDTLWLQPNEDAAKASFAPLATGFSFRIDASRRMWIRNENFVAGIAGAAGLKPGDEILTIDMVPANTFSFYETFDRFRKAGTRLSLRCRREDREFNVEYELVSKYPFPPEWPPEVEDFNPDASSPDKQ